MTDLTLPITDSVLNIRVLVLLKTPKGYIFEKAKEGYHFAIGGRVFIEVS